MNTAFVEQKQCNVPRDTWLMWALIGSMLAHVTFAFVMPRIEAAKQVEKAPELKVELVKIAAPEPVVAPEPPKPVPPPPKPKPKPIKKKVVRKPTPTPVQAPPPQPEISEPSPEPVETPPPVITAAPTVTETPKVVAPPPPPPPPPQPAGPSQADIDGYRSKLYAEFKRHQRYPKMAQRRGIQGDVDLLIGLDANGGVTNVTVVKSSGSSVLDKAAVKTVKKSNIKQLMPSILKGKIDQIKVTLSFKLQ